MAGEHQPPLPGAHPGKDQQYQLITLRVQEPHPDKIIREEELIPRLAQENSRYGYGKI
jgi:hypothetical protein